MKRPSSKCVALFASAGAFLLALGKYTAFADDKVFVDSDVSISVAVENYIAAAGDTTHINAVTGASSTDATATDTVTETPSTDASTEEQGVKYPEYQGKAIVVIENNVNIRAAADAESEKVGIISSGGVMNVMANGDEWTMVASGSVIGYINNDYIAFGDEAGEYAYKHVYKVAEVTATTLKVREKPDVNSKCITLIPLGETYPIAEKGDEWTKIEIDDFTGYVSTAYIKEKPASIYARPISEFIEPTTEATTQATTEAKRPSGNNNSSSNNNSSGNNNSSSNNNSSGNNNSSSNNNSSGNNNSSSNNNSSGNNNSSSNNSTQTSSGTGAAIAAYATQFVGNPYVYGGTSLTNGADCSGFTLSVYAKFGISLPHSARAQSRYGTEVSLSDLRPGDLVFYDYNTGSIQHVVIYIGNGQVCHASNRRVGIIINSLNYNTACKAVRLVN